MHSPQKVKFLIYSIITYYGKISAVLKNFLLIIIRNNHFNFFLEIYALFKIFFLQKINIRVLYITAVKRINIESKQLLEKNCINILKSKDFIFNFHYDSNILGGLILQINQEKLDLSKRVKINYFKEIINNKL
jgi:F0F1-type ATP synthase delta subunit